MGRIHAVVHWRSLRLGVGTHLHCVRILGGRLGLGLGLGLSSLSLCMGSLCGTLLAKGLCLLLLLHTWCRSLA